jgi:fructuronate reductase/mannitol 2-dehydrogenase
MHQIPRSTPVAARPLRNETLDHHEPAVGVPTYDRAGLTPGVVHIGVGRFHRAHQALYFHELAERGVRDWGVIGVCLRSRGVKAALEPQDCLYTVVERGPGGDRARVVGSLDRVLHAPEDAEAVLDALTDPGVRLVTLTVTANGYHLDAATLDLDTEAAEIAADLAHPQRPSTFIGYVAEALDRRRRAGLPPFTVLSCDNVPRNGDTTRAVVVSFARHRDPALAAWIEAHVRFPNSMVDRITPETSDADARYLAEAFGVEDRAPVMTEPFRQWVVEDAFAAGRPPLEQVGVQFVADVRPYELMKKRLLNGSHTAVAYLGYLAGHRALNATMADPAFRAFVGELMDSELTPLLPAVPGIDLGAYKATLLERLANPRISDELRRLCRRGSTKVPCYLLAPIREAQATGTPSELLTLAVAGWLRYSRGVGFAAERIDVQDARSEELRRLATRGGVDPRPMLRQRSIFGDLSGDEAFAEQLERALRTLERRGPRGAIGAYLAAPAQPVVLEEAA